MSPLLRAAELKLADWCARENGATDQEWGRWEGQPRALYRACAQVARTLSWADVAAIGGAEVQAFDAALDPAKLRGLKTGKA